MRDLGAGEMEETRLLCRLRLMQLQGDINRGFPLCGMLQQTANPVLQTGCPLLFSGA